jgi:hypothetical protein
MTDAAAGVHRGARDHGGAAGLTSHGQNNPDAFIVGFQHEHEARTFPDELKNECASSNWRCTGQNPADPLWPLRGQATREA